MTVTIVTDEYGDITYGVFAGGREEVMGKHFPHARKEFGYENSYQEYDESGYPTTYLAKECELQN